MAKFDIHDQFGGKIGELREEPVFFGGEKKYAIHDIYGGKIGEIQESPDYEGQAIAGVALAVLGAIVIMIMVVLFPLYVAYRILQLPIGKSMTIGLALILVGLSTALPAAREGTSNAGMVAFLAFIIATIPGMIVFLGNLVRIGYQRIVKRV